MNKADIVKRLKKELITIPDQFDITFEQPFYTEKQYQNLKRALLVMNQMGMNQQQQLAMFAG